MAENICRFCGLDCRSPMPLEKHEKKCSDSYEFYERHEKKAEKCPICRETWRDFWIKDQHTWVCLTCGCHFSPRHVFEKVHDLLNKRRDYVRGK